MFTVAVWTASGRKYGERQSELAFFWTGECCSRRYDTERVTRKPLRKVRRLGHPPETFKGNYGNGIPVHDSLGGEDDDELPRLSTWLRTLGGVADVRRIEKRWWWRSGR